MFLCYNSIMLQDILKKIRAYFRRLLFPLYLFPLKLVTYSLYYMFRALGRLVIALIQIILDMVVYPFTSLRNFLKSICLILLLIYIAASLVVMNDYFTRQYGRYTDLFCSVGVKAKLKEKVVRIVGGYSEGSGFFIAPNQVMTNFHVIDGESSPKIILAGGEVISPIDVVGDINIDLAVLTLPLDYPSLVLPLPYMPVSLLDSEPLLSTGYPLGTELTGEATILSGRFIAMRSSSSVPATYLQSDINVVSGMSGGPLTDQCGRVVGINTAGLAGLSLFIDAYQASIYKGSFTDVDVEKIEVDATRSPEDAVIAFYTYIKARDMLSGFNLLSEEYLAFTSYAEWTSRFTDILDIRVFKTEMVQGAKDTVFVKFATKSWTGTEAVHKYYEGVWVTKKEGDTYKMRRSMIKEVLDPSSDWYYTGPEF